ncbi:substrate-binding periplasmic protein [Kiloniella litopenaei]|uniref:substrate-binding periplasmic protein n=1 Tax=Kiloniella litopenaei TaxID=1549748 RepID=UPI003BA8A8E3
MSLIVNSLLFSLMILILMATPLWAEEPELVIHSVDFPPYEIENPGSDNLRGFDVEVVIEAFDRVNVEVEVNFLPWKRIVAMARAGTTLAMLSCEKTTERKEFIYYSNPISKATRTYVASAEYSGKTPYSMEDAHGAKILVISGYAAEDELKKANLKYEPVIDDMSALRILLSRDYDFFYSSREFVEYTARGQGIADKFQYFDTGKQVFFHLCFSKKWPNSKVLRDKFDKGLEEIQSDGTYDAIHAKYK